MYLVKLGTLMFVMNVKEIIELLSLNVDAKLGIMIIMKINIIKIVSLIIKVTILILVIGFGKLGNIMIK